MNFGFDEKAFRNLEDEPSNNENHDPLNIEASKVLGNVKSYKGVIV